MSHPQRHPLRRRPPSVSVLSQPLPSPKPCRYPTVSKRSKNCGGAIRNAPEYRVGTPTRWTWMIPTERLMGMRMAAGPMRKASTPTARSRRIRRNRNASTAPNILRALSASHAANILPDTFGNPLQCTQSVAAPMLTNR